LVITEAQNQESIEVARRVVEAASNKQAENLVLLDIRQVCSFAEYFVIGTADSERQVDAIVQEISEQLKAVGVKPYRSEGKDGSGWILIDLGSVIVHIFSPEQREYYKLDELWHDAIPVIRIQ
jgi:ribosome-associated protein